MNTEIIYTFEKIYQSESDAIFRFCLIRISHREQARDITQETFLRLWQTLSSGKEVQNPRAFLFTIAHHLIIDWYRKKKSLSLESMLYNKTKGESEYNFQEDMLNDNGFRAAEARYLIDKIKELKPAYRHAIYLRFIEDLSPRDIGVILGISTNTASVRINRALVELRKKIKSN